MQRVSQGTRRCAKVIVAFALAGVFSGCATMKAAGRGFVDYAPNGMERSEHALRQSLAAGSFDAVRRNVGGKGKDAPDDRLLRTLYVGMAAYYAGNHVESAAAFGRAGDIADDRYTRSISRGALALVANDLALPYTLPPTERLLAPFYAMMSFAARNDMHAAAVEARKIGALLEQYEDAGESVDSSLRLVLRYMSGAVFDAAGESDAAGVSYRNVAALAPDRGIPGRGDPGTGGDVVILVERGFIAHKIERQLVVSVGGCDTAGLANGKGDAAISRLVAQVASEPGGGAWHDPQPARISIRSSSDPEEHLLTLAWPAFARSHGASGKIRTGELGVTLNDSLHEMPVASADLSASVAADLARRLPMVLARAAARAAVKYSAASEVEEKNGFFAGQVTKLFGSMLERADTRSWHLLPDELSVVRLHLPPGTHRLAVTIPGAGGNHVRVLDLGNVDVTTGSTHFVTARLWADGDR